MWENLESSYMSIDDVMWHYQRQCICYNKVDQERQYRTQRQDEDIGHRGKLFPEEKQKIDHGLAAAALWHWPRRRSPSKK